MFFICENSECVIYVFLKICWESSLMSWCLWKSTKIFEKICQSGKPVEMPSICLQIWLLKLSLTPQKAKFSNYLNTYDLKFLI